MNFAAGTEARLAAEAVVQILVENMCQEEPTGNLKITGTGGTSGDGGGSVGRDWKWGEKEDRDSHLLLLERGRSGLVLQAVCTVNDRKEGASRLIPMAPVFVSTPSSAERSGEEKP